MKKIILIVLFSFLFSNYTYAKEMTLLNDKSFIEEHMELDESEFSTLILSIKTKEYIGEYEITGYCACSYCCGKTNGVTASGTIATAKKTIAMPSNFPFGTKINIDDNTYVVEDRGGAITGNRVDMFFSSHEEALSFGRQYKKIYIEREEIYKLEQVQLNEYIAFTGDRLMRDRLATSSYDKDTDVTEWKNSQGKVLATRYKDKNGKSLHFVDKELYDEWIRRR